AREGALGIARDVHHHGQRARPAAERADPVARGVLRDGGGGNGERGGSRQRAQGSHASPPVKASIPSVCRCSRRAATWLVEGGGGILQNEGALIQAALTRFASKLRYPSPGSGRRNEDNALLLLRPLVGEGYGDLARK